jgi:hypothetical protein
VLAGEEAVDELVVRLRIGAGNESVDIVRQRGESDEIEVEAARECAVVGFRAGVNPSRSSRERTKASIQLAVAG